MRYGVPLIPPPVYVAAQAPDDLFRPREPGDDTESPPETLGMALAKITPTLIVVGIATGAAFAIGSGLIQRFVFRKG